MSFLLLFFFIVYGQNIWYILSDAYWKIFFQYLPSIYSSRSQSITFLTYHQSIPTPLRYDSETIVFQRTCLLWNPLVLISICVFLRIQPLMNNLYSGHFSDQTAPRFADSSVTLCIHASSRTFLHQTDDHLSYKKCKTFFLFPLKLYSLFDIW